MKKNRFMVIVSAMILTFYFTGCSRNDDVRQQIEKQGSEIMTSQELPEYTEKAEDTSNSETTDSSDHCMPEYIKEKFPLPEDMYSVNSIRICNGGLLLNGPQKETEIGFEISVFGEDGQDDKVSVTVPGPYENPVVFVTAVFSDGKYLYTAGQLSRNGSFVFRYSISEKTVEDIKYFDDFSVRDMTYDRNREEFLLLTCDGEIVSLGSEFETKGKVRLQDQLPSGTGPDLNPEYIAVDSFSNIHLSCGRRLSDYNEYDCADLLVLNADFSFKSISEIKSSDGEGTVYIYGVSSLSDGSAGLFYKDDGSVYVRRSVNGGIQTEDILLMSDVSYNTDISCGRSNSDYVVTEQYSDDRKGTCIELRNIGNDSPDTVIERSGYLFSPNTKGINLLYNRYCFDDTVFSVSGTTNYNGCDLYEYTDFSGKVLNTVVQERSEMSGFSVTDSGSILFKDRSSGDGAVIREKTETDIIDIFEIPDFSCFDVSEVIQTGDRYIVVFKSSWYSSLYDDIKTLIRIYSDKGEVLSEADFTSIVSIVSLSGDSGMPEMIIEDNCNIYSVGFDIEKKTSDISERSDITELFTSCGLLNKEYNHFISERNGGKYDAYITRDDYSGRNEGFECIYGYNAADNTLTKIIDHTVLKGYEYGNVCVSDSGDIYCLLYQNGRNSSEVHIFKCP